jgi:hypothetical protein
LKVGYLDMSTAEEVVALAVERAAASAMAKASATSGEPAEVVWSLRRGLEAINLNGSLALHRVLRDGGDATLFP